MNFGLSSVEFGLLRVLVIDPLKKAGARVYVFGSRATGKNHKFSDIDVLVEAESSDILRKMMSNARDAIEESNFPINVDLVLMSELAQSYRENVLSHRIEL